MNVSVHSWDGAMVPPNGAGDEIVRDSATSTHLTSGLVDGFVFLRGPD